MCCGGEYRTCCLSVLLASVVRTGIPIYLQSVSHTSYSLCIRLGTNNVNALDSLAALTSHPPTQRHSSTDVHKSCPQRRLLLRLITRRTAAHAIIQRT